MNRKLIIFALVATIIAAGGAGYLLWRKDSSRLDTPGVRSGIVSGPSTEEGSIPALSSTTSPLYEKVLRSGAASSGAGILAVSDAAEENRRMKLRNEIMLLCDYLDSREYAHEHGFTGGTYRFLIDTVNKLAVQHPIVADETKDAYRLSLNMAHFCRVGKKEAILVVKDVIAKEGEIVEPSLALLYEWLSEETDRKDSDIKITNRDLYEYAAFILNTLSGRAYLMRRDSRTRLLVSYYSLLILDRANKERINHYGIDLLSHWKLLIDDMENYGNLEGKKEYLSRLRTIGQGFKNRS